MFFGATSMNGDVSDWDVSRVWHFRSMFNGASVFNGNLEKWNMSSANTTRGMFQDASTFEGKGLSTWDVSRVVDMNYCFLRARRFNGDISQWDVSRVSDICFSLALTPFPVTYGLTFENTTE